MCLQRDPGNDLGSAPKSGGKCGENFRWNKAVNPKGYPVGPDRLGFIPHLVD